MPDYDPTEFAEQTIESRVVFEGRLLRLRVDSVRLPDGGVSTREVVEHPGAVAVVPLTDDGHVYMVRQWRHPIEMVTLEIPAGTLHGDEDPLQCVRRELAEETGMRAGRIEHLLDIFVSLGYANEKIRIYLGSGLEPADGTPDEDEKLQVVRLSFAEAVAKCTSGEIVDSKTIAALLLLQLRSMQQGAQRDDQPRQVGDD